MMKRRNLKEKVIEKAQREDQRKHRPKIVEELTGQGRGFRTAKKWKQKKGQTVHFNTRRQRPKELASFTRNFPDRVDLIPNKPEIQEEFGGFPVIGGREEVRHDVSQRRVNR